MPFTVQQYIDMVRSVHPAFSRYMVPDKSLADFATREQQRLMSLAVLRDRTYLAQPLPILFDLTNADADAVGVAGAGTAGGVPGQSDGSGGYTVAEATTGSAVSVSSGTVYVSNTVVSAATATTASAVGTAWATNEHANRVALIVAGKGAGQSPRSILSNTSGQFTVSAAWEVTPDTTSVFQIVAGTPTLDGTLGAVTDLPSTVVERGFLVRLNSAGVPVLDYTKPLIAHVGRGVPLPPYHAVLGGTVRFTGADAQTDYDAIPLQLVHEAMRQASFGRPTAYLKHGAIFFCGTRADWAAVESVELSYVPIPPAFTSRTDLFLLPDTALPVIAARAALFAASRIAGIPDVPQPPADLLAAEAKAAEDSFLTTISLSSRSRVSRVKPGGY